MGLSRTALKILLMIVNVILFLCGGSILGVGIWAVSDKIYIGDVVGNSLFASASYLMVIVGTVLIVIAFLGCALAITGKKIIGLVYPITLAVLFILLMTAAICAAVFQNEVEDGLMELMKQSIRLRYGHETEFDDENADVTSSWDNLQSSLGCCGVEDRGWSIYQESRWFQQQYMQTVQMKKYVPMSCCKFSRNQNNYMNENSCQSFKFGPPTIVGPYGAVNNALYYDGCYNRVREYVVGLSTIVLALGFSFLVFLVAGIVISLMYYWKIKTYGTGSADLKVKDPFNDKRNLRDSERRGFHDRDHRDKDEPDKGDYKDYRDSDVEPGHRMSGRQDRKRQDHASDRSDDRSDYRDNDDERRSDRRDYRDNDDERRSDRRDYRKPDHMSERSDDRDDEDEPFKRRSGRRDHRKQDQRSERSDDRSDYRDDDRDNYEDYDAEPKKVRLPSYKHSAI